jgi:hypothetical protein
MATTRADLKFHPIKNSIFFNIYIIFAKVIVFLIGTVVLTLLPDFIAII